MKTIEDIIKIVDHPNFENIINKYNITVKYDVYVLNINELEIIFNNIDVFSNKNITKVILYKDNVIVGILTL